MANVFPRTASAVKIDLDKYRKALYDDLDDLAERAYERQERVREKSYDTDDLADKAQAFLGETALVRRFRKTPNQKDISAITKQLIERYKETGDQSVRDSVNEFMDLWDTFAEVKGLDQYRQDIQQGFDQVYLQTESYAKGLAKLLQDALKRTPVWNGSDLSLKPSYTEGIWGNIDKPIRAYYVTVGKHSGFSVFLNDNGTVEAVDDVLEAGDPDFFRTPEDQMDYFNLVRELHKPGSTTRPGRDIVLYTARPTKDRSRYEGARTVPTNIFLTTDPDRAEGFGRDVGGRDLWRVVINERYLTLTLDAGRLKDYQTIGKRDVPVKSMSLVAEGKRAHTKTAAYMLVRKFLDVRKPLFHATTGPRSARIVEEGLKEQSGFSNFGGQTGISMTRDLGLALSGAFGNYILVFDEMDLRNRFKMAPFQHGAVREEFEERVLANHIPPSYIRGMIIPHAQRYELKDLKQQNLPFPVVYKDKGGWQRMARQTSQKIADLKIMWEGKGRYGNPEHITRREEGTISTREALKLKGKKGEQHYLKWHKEHGEPYFGRYPKARWDAFVDDIRQHGIREPVFIVVDHEHGPLVYEGNHRIQAADQAGLREIPVEIRYFGHAEQDQLVDPRQRRASERISTLSRTAKMFKPPPKMLEAVTKLVGNQIHANQIGKPYRGAKPMGRGEERVIKVPLDLRGWYDGTKEIKARIKYWVDRNTRKHWQRMIEMVGDEKKIEELFEMDLEQTIKTNLDAYSYLRLVMKYDYDPYANWWSAMKTLTVSLGGWDNAWNTPEGSVEHEMMHFATDLLAQAFHGLTLLDPKEIPDLPGLPPMKFRTPQFQQMQQGKYDPEAKYTYRELHALDDVEFYTELRDALERFDQRYRVSNPSKALIDRFIQVDEFFKALRRAPEARDKYREAVREFYDALRVAA